ncbi:hypothetical protein PSTT_06121 [Puccinia striiformis]|uniref:EF-hand domain-containing protein n=1 Tax=Puccinia striiformis TaxID=27350 RepID=A0A2S4VL44_9BASI|nr:hypothetical protein PSTT_06121 [Puccinia striiformis]
MRRGLYLPLACSPDSSSLDSHSSDSHYFENVTSQHSAGSSEILEIRDAAVRIKFREAYFPPSSNGVTQNTRAKLSRNLMNALSSHEIEWAAMVELEKADHTGILRGLSSRQIRWLRGDPLEELTRPQLLEINRVFNAIVSGNSLDHSRRLKTLSKTNQSLLVPNSPTAAARSGRRIYSRGSETLEGGGFIVEDQETSAGGGFLVEDQSRGKGFEGGGFLVEETGADVEAGGFFRAEEAEADSGLDESIDHGKRRSSEHGHQSNSSRKVSNYMSIRKIPDALKMLNLPYRNSEILSIFENAASSDEEDRSDRQSRSIQPKEKLISRIKFSKVCAVLMVANGDDDDDSGWRTTAKGSSDQASSTSDYQPDPPPHGTSTRSRPRKGTQSLQTRTSPTSECAPSDVVLSKARPQRRQAKGKKAKRFSEAEGEEDVRSSDLSNHTIGFEDIRRAADQLGETMSDEEISEMLNYASYTNNSRVTFQAFERLVKEIRTV